MDVLSSATISAGNLLYTRTKPNIDLRKWQSRAAFWQPQEVEDESCEYLPNRLRGHPLSKWDDRVSRFTWNHFGKRWQDVPHAEFFGALEKFVGEAPGA